MKKSNKIVAFILAVSMVISVFTVPVFANEDVDGKPLQVVYTVLDKVVNGLVGGIAAMIKTPKWTKEADYKTSPAFIKGTVKADGTSDFTNIVKDGQKWSLGYSTASILTGNEVGETCDGDYYVGGSLSVTKKLATAQWDDQVVRTIAISDGRYLHIFAVLDAYGMANTDVLAIREKFLEGYKGRMPIGSINISALHQHSCVDTFGMNGDIVSALFTSSFKTTFGIELPSGQNKKFMENLYNVTIKSMNDAIDNMTEGTLKFGTVNVEEFIREKRDPIAFDPNINCFRFIPGNGSRETWICNAGIHCVGNGAAGTELTGDYPLYMQRYIDKNYNANFFYILGAELAISQTDHTETETEPGIVKKYISANEAEWAKEATYNSNTNDMRAMGEIMAQKLYGISEWQTVAPILNTCYKETKIKIDNNILILAAKGGLLVNNVVKSGLGKFKIVTEVGYAEFGNNIAVAIIPGELEACIAFGINENPKYYKDLTNGCQVPGALCWNGEEWENETFKNAVGNKKLVVFGLTNDQVGYLLMNNEWHSIFTENEEVVSAGKMAADTVAKTFLGIVKEYKTEMMPG